MRSSKAISYIISSILMLVIVMGLGGVTYIFITGTFTRSTSQSFTIIDTYNDTITISNSGSEPIESITAKVDGQSAVIAVTPNIGNLVGHWGLNEGSGTATSDASGLNNHGTLQDMEADDWVAGKYGNALDFDDANDKLVASNFGSNVISISAWVKIDRTTTFYVVEVAPAYVFRIYNSGQVAWLRRDTGLTWRIATSPADVVPQGIWTHVAAVDDGNYLRIYVNGEPSGTPLDRSAYVWQTTSTQLKFGYSSWWGTYSGGDLDDVMIFDKALTQEEVRQLASGLVDTGKTSTIKLLTPLSRGSHTVRICTPSMCTRGSLMII